ncbi:MAG: helix-turn-helix transcriptional regulator [Myxococcota bacterium]
MSINKPRGSLFAALLKYWRGRRGLSQLDLALAADVSTRHVSFLETGRSAPSEDMVLRLAATLQIPMRAQNEMLVAEGFDPYFDEPDVHRGLAPAIEHAIDFMMEQHEPFPLAVMNYRYDLVKTNRSGQRMLSQFIADFAALEPPVNACKLLFDPRGLRPYLVDWEIAARHLLVRIQRDALTHNHRDRLQALVEELASYPDVPKDWQKPDLSLRVEPVMSFSLERDGQRLSFLTTLTVFSAPTDVTVEELLIESYFPLDETTERACRDASSTGGKTAGGSP